MLLYTAVLQIQRAIDALLVRLGSSPVRQETRRHDAPPNRVRYQGSTRQNSAVTETILEFSVSMQHFTVSEPITMK